jgi:hypothetical protein
VYFMLSGFFGVLIDLVADYVRRNIIAAPPYLSKFAGSMRCSVRPGFKLFQCLDAWSRLGTEASVPCLLTFPIAT